MNEVYVVVSRRNDGVWIERISSVEVLTSIRIVEYYENDRGFDFSSGEDGITIVHEQINEVVI